MNLTYAHSLKYTVVEVIKSTWLVMAAGVSIIYWLFDPPVSIEMEPVTIVADQCVEVME